MRQTQKRSKKTLLLIAVIAALSVMDGIEGIQELRISVTGEAVFHMVIAIAAFLLAAAALTAWIKKV